MATASLVDYLSEKMYSLSSKMWGSSIQPNSTSFLMNGNKSFQQYDLSTILAEVKDRNDCQISTDPISYQFLPLQRFSTGILESLKKLNKSGNKNNFMSYMTDKGFSPYLFNFASDSYGTKYGLNDSPLISPNSKFLNSAKESVLIESHMKRQKTDNNIKKVNCYNPQIIEMSLDVSHSPSKEKSEIGKENCEISPTVRLNIELAHRKTKEMSKRSKRRRRRLKKSEQLNINSSASASDDEEGKNECFPTTDSVCFLSESPDFGCTLSVTHSVQFSSCNSFLIPVKSDSDDDSEWETINGIEISSATDGCICETDSNGSSNSTPIKCGSLKSSSFKTVNCDVHVSSIISFVVPEDNSDDDNSDWDTCEAVTFPENIDFELPGLYFTNLCTPQTYNTECNFDSTFEEESEEKLHQRAVILEANNKWNELDESQKPKSTTKVTFAPDEDLVEIFPVEVYERKGEWEMFVTARDRFKRRVSELEKIISPCLTADHRSKIFKEIIEPHL